MKTPLPLGLDSLTAGQKSTLSGIAAQCPVSGGSKAVYQARAMLSKYQDVVYDDVQLCLQQGIVKNQVNKTAVQHPFSFKVFPNPATTFINLSWENPANESCFYHIHDVLGQLVLSGSFTLEGQYQLINTGDTPEGMYTISLFGAGNRHFAAKVAILKH